MSTEEGDFWREVKDHKKKEKVDNIARSLKLLEENGIEYRAISVEGRHYRTGDWDFWPSTEKFRNYKTGAGGWGMESLIKKLNK